jgi:hypothetical protein
MDFARAVDGFIANVGWTPAATIHRDRGNALARE